MIILNLLIIYLACGCPFSVNKLLRLENGYSTFHVLSSVAVILYWPLIVFSALHRKYGQRRSVRLLSDKADPDLGVMDLSNLLEDEWLDLFGDRDAASFHERLEQYIGLSFALLAPDGRSRAACAELARVSDHPDPDLADACFDRRNRQKLEVHRTQARMRVIEDIERLGNAIGVYPVDLAVSLVSAMDDETGEIEMRLLREALVERKEWVA